MLRPGPVPAIGNPAISNPVSGILSVLAACAIAGLPFVRSAPNRMMTGEPVGLWPVLMASPSLLSGLLGLALLLCLITSVLKPSRALLWLQVGGCTKAISL